MFEAKEWASAAGILLGPLWLLSLVLVPRAWANRNALLMTKVAATTTWAVFGLAILAAIGVALNGKTQFDFVSFGVWKIGVYFDILSAIIFLLVSFLGAIVTRFSRHYLKGDASQGHFLKWLCVTIGAVLTLIVSSNLVMFTVSWIATSLSLNQLLTFYADRPAALVAARKKIVISRLGDLCLIGAVVLTFRIFGTWDFAALFAAAEQMRATLRFYGRDESFCRITVRSSHELMQRAIAGMVCSGTATLEAAFFGLPLCVVYKVAWLTWVVGKRLVKVPFLGMPNVLAGREIAREFLQDAAQPQALADETLRLATNAGQREAVQAELAAVIAGLGEGGAAQRAADAILEELEPRRRRDAE